MQIDIKWFFPQFIELLKETMPSAEIAIPKYLAKSIWKLKRERMNEIIFLKNQNKAHTVLCKKVQKNWSIFLVILRRDH